MKTICKVLLLLSLYTFSYASNTQIESAMAIGIFDKNGNGENIQKLRKTKNDYNGEGFTKIVVIGKYFHTKPVVYVGNSPGNLIKRESIYNKQKIKIGEILTYKHFNISKGYIKVSIDNRTYDMKVFVK